MVEIIGKIARNGHLTIPRKIRKILNIENGDIVRFSIENNKIVISPSFIVDKDKAYFFTEKCQKEIRKSEKEFREKKYSSYASVKDLKKVIDSD
ncbi:MAG: AbrB/MazE/SpoVT family DNA-binding domain-containing protein [Candidatus Atribacteria bacterium]|nr:AbrB/MazE/SpoVT family DNA-binding domain-containing protein [Candidatus Atribacteria bacterium]